MASRQPAGERTWLAGDSAAGSDGLRRRSGGAQRKEHALSKRIVATLGVVALLAALVALGTGPASGAEPKTLQNAVGGRLKAPQIPVMKNGRQVGTKRSSFLSSGLLKAAEEVDNKGGVSAADDRLFAADGAVTAETGKRDIGIGAGTLGCRNRNTNGNVRVNQDCTFRRNAENDIVYNPAQPTNLLAGSNDSRVGYNQCSIAWSLDNGRHWGDLLPPFRRRPARRRDPRPPQLSADGSIVTSIGRWSERPGRSWTR
jgi:hypothetical protein